jgi:hypothetical protein
MVNVELSIVNKRRQILTLVIGNRQLAIDYLLGLTVHSVIPAPGAVFFQLQPRLVVAAVLFARVVALFTLCTRQRDNNANCFFCHESLSVSA